MEALENTKEDYEKFNCTPNQVELIQIISTFLCIIIEIPESVMKGIVWNALKEWQLKKDKTISDIAEMQIGNRLNAVKEIFYFGNKILKEMLKQPKAQNEIIIDIAFEKAFKYYLDYINKSFN